MDHCDKGMIVVLRKVIKKDRESYQNLNLVSVQSTRSSLRINFLDKILEKSLRNMCVARSPSLRNL